jgi:ubiquinone/menaquinone biosynthesis C-methylase UbiE
MGAPAFIKAAVTIIDNEWNRLNASLSKFTSKAENYAKYRPSYPKEVIDLIFSESGKNKLTFADFGSGTGIMSELLLKRNGIVYAIEPNEDMRKEAEARLSSNKNFHSIPGSAENTTLNADSVDVIVCAESYHWFDNEKTLLEMKRILKPEGLVFLL